MLDGQFHQHALLRWSIDINPEMCATILRGVMVCPNHGQFVATEQL